MRINKYIAHAGVASRRKAEELIKEGRVTLMVRQLRNWQQLSKMATLSR